MIIYTSMAWLPGEPVLVAIVTVAMRRSDLVSGPGRGRIELVREPRISSEAGGSACRAPLRARWAGQTEPRLGRTTGLIRSTVEEGHVRLRARHGGFLRLAQPHSSRGRLRHALTSEIGSEASAHLAPPRWRGAPPGWANGGVTRRWSFGPARRSRLYTLARLGHNRASLSPQGAPMREGSRLQTLHALRRSQRLQVH